MTPRNASFHVFSSPFGHFSLPFSSTSGKSPIRSLTHGYNGGERGHTGEGADVPPLRTCVGFGRFTNRGGIDCGSHWGMKGEGYEKTWLICAGMTSVDQVEIGTGALRSDLFPLRLSRSCLTGPHLSDPTPLGLFKLMTIITSPFTAATNNPEQFADVVHATNPISLRASLPSHPINLTCQTPSSPSLVLPRRSTRRYLYQV